MSSACLGCGEHVEDCSCEERRFWQLREALADVTAFHALATIGLAIAFGLAMEVVLSSCRRNTRLYLTRYQGHDAYTADELVEAVCQRAR